MYGLCMENMLKIIVNQSKQIFSTIRKYLIFILKCFVIGVRGKEEKISEDSLDSIPSPSPSVKIQIMGGKGVKAKHCWMLSTNF